MVPSWLSSLPVQPVSTCLGCRARVDSSQEGISARILFPVDQRERWLTLCWRCALRWVEDDTLRATSVPGPGPWPR